MSSPSGTNAVQVGSPGALERSLRSLALPAEWWSAGPRLVSVAFQLVLIALVLRTWRIDGAAFRLQFSIVCVGFVIHHLLPLGIRLPFFVLLSMVSLGTLLGVSTALYLVCAGLLLIAVAHAPLPFAARVGLLVVLGLAMAAFRNSAIPAMTGIWPILGSMFMFRLMVYMHDLRTGIAPFGVWRALAYFFMIPNACFPLFPLVDYKTFTRTYYNREAVDIYQKGVDWILRGVIQLILYRFVYQNLVMNPQQVADAGDLARYLVTNFLLYLRVSGNFHLIIGMLHLFGFNLPETHHKYLLSSSFTDFWRRINIYWKDFIQKMFFFPVYFRVKRHGEIFAIAVATCLSFVATWALHSYQWFWLRGNVLFTWQDMSFWTILALGVLVNVLYEAKTTRRRAALKLSWSWRGELARALSTIAMFSFICLLWSLWNAESLDSWLTMLSKARYISLASATGIVTGLAMLGVAAVTMGRTTSERTDAPGQPDEKTPAKKFWWAVTKTSVLATLLVIVGRYPIWFAGMPAVADTLDRLTTHQLNVNDTATLERGYYEDLTGEAQFSPELAELYHRLPSEWQLREVNVESDEKKLPSGHYRPNVRRTLSDGTTLSTNRWGMRDRDYTKEKPPEVYRLALLGDSLSFGYGVGDEHVFEQRVEQRLNRPGAAAGVKYEILNFASSGYGPYGRLQYLRLKAIEFEPDAVLSVAVNDVDWMLRDISRWVNRNIEIPDPFVANIVAKAGLTPGMGRRIVEHRLMPYALELVKWDYVQIVELCRAHGALPIAVFLPRANDRSWEKDQLPQLIRIAQEAGFTVLDLTSAYNSVDDWSTLWRRSWDVHPNERGHQLLAELCYEELKPLIVPPPPRPESGDAAR
jgi:lysophospholipase L1-like esterase/D-alanyl-lipoteichoic acid acyltransferase DltB (MBOAT superfamily)